MVVKTLSMARLQQTKVVAPFKSNGRVPEYLRPFLSWKNPMLGNFHYMKSVGPRKRPTKEVYAINRSWTRHHLQPIAFRASSVVMANPGKQLFYASEVIPGKPQKTTRK